MKKFFSQFRAPTILLLLMIATFAVPHFAHASFFSISDIASDAINKILQTISTAVLGLASLLSYIAGLALNQSVQFTIIDIAKNIGGNAPGTFGASISSIWGTIRDIANMSFIFVLLYTAIQTMLGKGDYKKTIVNIIVAAILVNFSIFFTKVIIDAGNLVALTFYHAIVPASSATGALPSGGISDAFTQQLHLSTLWKPDLSAGNIVTIGLLGSVFLVIASFVFLAVALMFVVRYVILIIVIILSPLAFVADAVPGLKSYGKQWWDALINQTFFPAIYFLLTWIVLKLISTAGFIPGNLATAIGGIPGQAGVTADPNAVTTIFNFILLIAFLIMTLILSKGMADKGSKGLNKWVGGVAGGATIGIAGRFARGTVGRYAQTKVDDQKLNDRAAKGDISARLQLAAARKTASSSFDIRGTGLGKTLGAGDAQKGGFAKDMENRIKSEKEYADKFKPSDLVIAQAESNLQKTKDTAYTDPSFVKEWIAETDKREKRVADLEARRDMMEASGGKFSTAELDKIDREISDAKISHTSINNPDLDIGAKAYRNEKTASAQEKVDNLKGINPKDAKTRGVEVRDSALNVRREARAQFLEKGTMLGQKFHIFNRILGVAGVKKEVLASAAAIRKSKQEKRPADLIADAISDEAKKNAESTPATPPPTGGGATTP